MMGEDLHKFGRSSRLERNEFSLNGSAGIVNPASRQIYLTFPADSTFKEEDVSNYFRWVSSLTQFFILVLVFVLPFLKSFCFRFSEACTAQFKM